MSMYAFGSLPDNPGEALANELSGDAAIAQAGLYTLARASHAVLSSIEQIVGQHGLTPAQFRLSMVLTFVHPQGASMSQAAGTLAIKAPSLTELVKSSPELFDKGLSSSDRRQVLLTMSTEGQQRLKTTLPEVAAHAASLRQALGSDAWDTLVSNADHLFDLIEKGHR